MTIRLCSARNSTSSDIYEFDRQYAGREYPNWEKAVNAMRKAGYKIMETGEGYWIYSSDMSDAEIDRDVAGYDIVGSIEEVRV